MLPPPRPPRAPPPPGFARGSTLMTLRSRLFLNSSPASLSAITCFGARGGAEGLLLFLLVVVVVVRVWGLGERSYQREKEQVARVQA